MVVMVLNSCLAREKIKMIDRLSARVFSRLPKYDFVLVLNFRIVGNTRLAARNKTFLVFGVIIIPPLYSTLLVSSLRRMHLKKLK